MLQEHCSSGSVPQRGTSFRQARASAGGKQGTAGTPPQRASPKARPRGPSTARPRSGSATPRAPPARSRRARAVTRSTHLDRVSQTAEHDTTGNGRSAPSPGASPHPDPHRAAGRASAAGPPQPAHALSPVTGSR